MKTAQASDEVSAEERRWTNMISWLVSKGFDSSQLALMARNREGAGRGLYASRVLQPPSKPFLRIPQNALLNSRTLRSIYPKVRLEGHVHSIPTSKLVLNGTQILSIHLAIYRPQDNSDSEDPDFGPYLSTLPREFRGHPLSWLVRKKLDIANTTELEMLCHLPPSVLATVQAVHKRYVSDWQVAQECLKVYSESFPPDRRTVSEADFLWGWLAVNTRCLYYKVFTQNLPLSDLTLCPLVDLANHTASDDVPFMKPKPHKRKPGMQLPTDFVFTSPDCTVHCDEEIFLRYGNHCNRVLFAEYGFVDEYAAKEVEVTDIVKEVVAQKPMPIRRLELLDGEGYLSDLSVYTSPTPIQPTWRLLCALRLANLELPATESEEALNAILQPWREVINGYSDRISEANDLSVRTDIARLGSVLRTRSSEKIQVLKEHRSKSDREQWAYHAIAKLWEEERVVARGLLDSLASGYVFE